MAIKEKYLAHIHPALRQFAVKVDTLVPDPNNARKHGKRDLSATRASLEKFGQVLPIIVRKTDNVIMIGNGRASIFQKKKWRYIACIFTDLPEHEARMLAIADNRTGELAGWDNDALAKAMGDLTAAFPDVDMTSMLIGFDAADLNFSSLNEETLPMVGGSKKPPAMSQEYTTGYHIQITCKDDKEQAQLLERLEKENIACRAYMS